MVLSDASMLNKLSPFFTLIFSYIFLKEKLSPFQCIAIVIAFIGSLFIIKPSFDLTATFKDKIPDNINVGDRVTVSGTFEKGNLVGATLVKSTVVPVI